MAKILLILGSRNPSGQTATAGEAFLLGAASQGAEVERVFLPKTDLQRCRQCNDTGWGICRNKGRCIINDDFSAIVDKVKSADAVVFANPVYYGELSESMRAFLDRLRRIYRGTEGGIAGKPAVAICVAGGSGNGSATAIVSMEKVLLNCGFTIVDLVPVRRQNLEIKAETLSLTGSWLAKTMLTEEKVG